MIRNARTAVAGAALIVLAAGCKAPPPPIVAVEGIIRLDGRPLKGAAVRFMPQIDYGPEYVGVGVTDEAGRYQLSCKGRPGACVGENRVIVMEADIPSKLQGETAQVELAQYLQSLGGRPIPSKYGNLVESPLTANVKADQKQYDFDLAR